MKRALISALTLFSVIAPAGAALAVPVGVASAEQEGNTGDVYEQKGDYYPSGYVLQVTGRGGVPVEGVTAVALNVTVTETETGAHDGFVTVFPCGDRPNASNVNFVAGETVPNLVIAPVNAAGEVCLYVYGRAALIADVSGYFTTGIETLTPTRILDTRGGEKVGALDGDGAEYRLQVTGAKGIPAEGVTAVAMNVTATETETGEHSGFVTVFPCGERPDASNLNFVAGETVPNLTVTPVSASGEVCFYVYGKAHLLADISGYFTTGIETLTPTRILDTRRSDRKVGSFDGSSAEYRLQVTGSDGVPADGVTAVAMNVTATEAETGEHNGFVTVFPCGARPDASNLNFVAGETVPNLVIAPVSKDGEVCFYVYGKTHLLADVSGYFTTGIKTLTPTRILDTRPPEGWFRHDKVGDLEGSTPVNRVEACIDDYFYCLARVVRDHFDATRPIDDYTPTFPVNIGPLDSGWFALCTNRECTAMASSSERVWGVPDLQFSDFATFADNWCPDQASDVVMPDGYRYYVARCKTGHPDGGDFEVRYSGGTLKVDWDFSFDTPPAHFDSWSDWYRKTQGDLVEACAWHAEGCLPSAVGSYATSTWEFDYPPSTLAAPSTTGWIAECDQTTCETASLQQDHTWDDGLNIDDVRDIAALWCLDTPVETYGYFYSVNCAANHEAGGEYVVTKRGSYTVRVEWSAVEAPGFNSWADWYRHEGKNL